MRRKTKAKRLLEHQNEDEDEEEEEKQSYNEMHKRCKHSDAVRPDVEDPTSAHGLHKFDMKGCGIDCSSASHFHEGHTNAEEAQYLQSYSKMELIAMVLCMQREMESLKEQLRCLTACGKLARNLEALIERTQIWSDEDKKTPLAFPSSPVPVPVETDALMPAMPYGPALTNGHWVKQEPLAHNTNETDHRDGVFTEFITPELLERCNTGTTAQKLTNDLLRGLYERDCLASHSISGVVYNKRGQPKPALPSEEVQAILRTVQYFFPGKTDAEIKGYIRQKLQNEAKRLRKKPPVSGVAPNARSLSGPRSSTNLFNLSTGPQSHV